VFQEIKDSPPTFFKESNPRKRDLNGSIPIGSTIFLYSMMFECFRR
jgi:hypothetical protein